MYVWFFPQKRVRAANMEAERLSKMHFKIWQWNSSVLMNLFLFVFTLSYDSAL